MNYTDLGMKDFIYPLKIKTIEKRKFQTMIKYTVKDN